MRIERALKIRNTAKSATRDLYDSAQRNGLESRALNKAMESIRHEIAKAPAWVKTYIDGYAQACVDRLNCEPGLIVYGGFLDGRFLSTHSGRPDYYDKHGVSPAAFANKSDAGEVEKLGLYWGRFDPPRPWFLT